MSNKFDETQVDGNILEKLADLKKRIRDLELRGGVSVSASSVNSDGWIPVTETWTYASPNTINIPTGGLLLHKNGMGIRLKQGGAYKYYSNILTADTLLTVTGGTDYTVANAAITDVAYTLSPETAVGFPVTFNCAAPTWDTATIDNGTGGQQPTAGSQYFRVDGDRVNLTVAFGGSGAVKNGVGNIVTVSNIPATLPNIVSPIAGWLGLAIFATITTGIGLVYYVSGVSFDVLNNAPIADNASIAYTNLRIEYKY